MKVKKSVGILGGLAMSAVVALSSMPLPVLADYSYSAEEDDEDDEDDDDEDDDDDYYDDENYDEDLQEVVTDLLKSVEINTGKDDNVVSAGDNVTVVIGIDSKYSDSNFWGVCFIDEEYDDEIDIDDFEEIGSESSEGVVYYSGTISIGSRDKSCKYILYSIFSDDYYSRYNKGDIYFTIDNSESEKYADREAPVLQDITIESSTVNLSDGEKELMVTCHVTDNKSGVYFVILIFKNSESGDKVAITKVGQGTLDEYVECELYLKQDLADGEYVLNGLTIADKDENRLRYDETTEYGAALMPEEYLKYKFTVVHEEDTSIEDSSDAPILQGITFNPSTVNLGDGNQNIVITFHVTDNQQGVKRVQAMFENSEAGKSIWVQPKVVSNDTYEDLNDVYIEYELELDESLPDGEYTLNYLSLTDYDINAVIYEVSPRIEGHIQMPDEYLNYKFTVVHENETTTEEVSTSDSTSEVSTNEDSSKDEETESAPESTVVSNEPVVEDSKGWDSFEDKVEKAIEKGIVNVDLNGTDTIPEKVISTIAENNVTMAVKVDKNTLVTIDGSKITPAEASQVKLISSKDDDGSESVGVRSQNVDIEKSIVIFRNMGLDKVGNSTALYFENADKSLLEFRTSPVYENGFAAFEVPFVNANYKVAIK